MLQFLKASCKTYRTTDSNTSNCCSRVTASGVNRNINQFSKLCVDGLVKVSVGCNKLTLQLYAGEG